MSKYKLNAYIRGTGIDAPRHVLQTQQILVLVLVLVLLLSSERFLRFVKMKNVDKLKF